MQLSIVYINNTHSYSETHPKLFYKGGKKIIETAGIGLIITEETPSLNDYGYSCFAHDCPYVLMNYTVNEHRNKKVTI